MAEIQRQAVAALMGFVQSGAVQLVVRLVAVYVVAVWIAAAWWTFRDAENRTGSRAMAYVAAAWVILFSPAFFLFGLLIYRLVRPPELIADARDRQLAEAALLGDSLPDAVTCPRCTRPVEDGWLACPSCRLPLATLCPSCGRAAGFDWIACAWCGRSLDTAQDAPFRATVGARPDGALGDGAGYAATSAAAHPDPIAAALTSPLLAARTAESAADTDGVPADVPAFLEPARPPRQPQPVERRPRRARLVGPEQQVDRQTA